MENRKKNANKKCEHCTDLKHKMNNASRAQEKKAQSKDALFSILDLTIRIRNIIIRCVTNFIVCLTCAVCVLIGQAAQEAKNIRYGLDAL